MRIALVSQEYPPETAHGGIATQTYLKAHGLASLGHDITVVSHAIGDTRTEYKDGLVTVVRIPNLDSRLGIRTEVARWISYSLAVAIELEKLNTQAPFDLADFPEWACESYFHLLNRTAHSYVPIAIQLHGPLVMLGKTIGWPELDSELYRTGTAMEQTCLGLADLVYSSSACSADWCAREYGLDRENITILHTGVDINLFRPTDVPKSSRPTIIFVGKIERNKGIVLLVEAAIKLARSIPDLKLRLIGRGNADLISEIKAKAQAAGLTGLLDVPGPLAQTDLPAELSKAHAFAAPSVYEGGPGFVYLEAMACGLPVVACEGSGSSEIIAHGKTGLLTPTNDETALTEGLLRLLSNPDEARAMGKRGREYVENHASSTDCIRRLESIYLTVVRDKVKHAQMSA
jgi:glycosyltransferase involved in cell wall biosynthesis